MGKQLAIALAPEDEVLLLSYIKSKANVKLIENFASSIEGLWKDDFEKEYTGHFSYNIWNTAFPWDPEYNRSLNGDYYISNCGAAPIIEITRSNLRESEFGRIYWAKDFSAPNGLKYDTERFNSWYEDISKWIKKSSKGKLRGAWITYCLPQAWEQLKEKEDIRGALT